MAVMFGTSVLERRISTESADCLSLNLLDERHSAVGRHSAAAKLGLFPSDKENRPPAAAGGKKAAPGEERISHSALWTRLQEAEQLRERLAQEERLRVQAEARLRETQGARKSAADARALLEEKDEQLEELRRQCAELEASRGLAEQKGRAWKLRAESDAKAASDARRDLAEATQSPLVMDLDMDSILEPLKEKLWRGLDFLGGQVDELAERTLRSEELARGTRPAAAAEELELELAARAEAEAEAAQARRQLAEEAELRREAERRCEELSAQLETATAEGDLAAARLSQLSAGACGSAPEEDGDCELLAQNRELLLSMQMLKQEVEQLEAERRSLQESAAIFEQGFERVAGQQARQMGHQNHRQKIRYTLQMKEENSKLRDELKQARVRALKLEASKKGESLIEALAPLSSVRGRGCVDPFVYIAPRSRSSSRPAPPRPSRGSVSGGLEDATQRCREQEKILERISIDFRHFLSLLEAAVPDGDESGPSDAGGRGQLNALLERLRTAKGRRD
mmetsp:Transcript_24625/g.54417  ORF Transcript_24625/g.54417 Transcript_24625/m.54417 type:complete len:513 (-) Transcript_24625:110-1648(-)